MPPLSALRAFEAAARLGSLSAAARELNVTHPAIAQAVKRLEDWFGQPLMHREGRGVAPTEAGVRLAVGLTEGFGAIRRAVESLMDDDRPLAITLTPTFAAHWLMPRLGAFRAAHPDISLTLDPTTETVDLRRRTHDLGIRFGEGRWPGLDADLLMPSDLRVAAAPSLLEGHCIGTPADLLELPWVQELGTDELGVWMRAHGVENAVPRNVVRMPGNLMFDAIRRGEAIGITGGAWLARDVADKRIVTLFDDTPPPDLGYWIVTPPGVLRPAARTFIRWLKREAG